MRVAFCIFKYFPYGGIQRDLMKIVRECKARGHQTKIYTLRWEAEEPPGEDVQVIPIEGLSRHRQYERFAERVRDAVSRDPDGFDLVVGFNKMPGLDVYYAGDSCYAEKAERQRSVGYRLLPRYRSLLAAERAVFDRFSATQILTLSNVEVPAYRTHHGALPERFHALPPGIEADRVAHRDEAWRAEQRATLRGELGLAEDTRVLLFIGSGFIKKGLDRVLLGVAALPADLRKTTHLVVIGRDKAEAFERMAMRLGIESIVTFFSSGRDDIPHFLFAADGLVHPAYDETAGMVIIEAMLAGLPALVTGNCGYAPYLAQHQAGLVLEGSFVQKDFNSALVELLTSDERADWRQKGMAAGGDPELFSLVPRAVDYLEKFAGERKPLLVFALFRYFAFGGLQRDFMAIVTRCVASGYRVLVYCMEWRGPHPDAFEVIEIAAHGIGNHARYESFAREVVQACRWRRPRAVIGFNKMPNLDIYYAADPCFEAKAREMRNWVYRLTPRYRSMAGAERAVFGPDSNTRVMLITEHQRQQFVAHYRTQAERLFLLPPGVNRDRCRGPGWEADRARVRHEFEVSADDFLLVLIGSGFITKGLDRALRALADLPEDLRERSTLVVIGQDNPAQFLRLARQMKVDRHLKILHGRSDIPAILQGADVMVHPAYMESGGLVLIEGVISGLPVITTAACGFAHYVTDADAGFVLDEPFRQEALNEQLVRVLRDRELRARWSANGVRFGCETQEIYDMPEQALKFIEANLPEVSVAVSS